MAHKTWQERAEAVLANGCLTFSKHPSQFIEGVSPTHCDGRRHHTGFSTPQGLYHDFVCGLGSNLINFENNFSIPSTQEIVLAERIKALFPCIDKLKILKTGTATTDCAIRFARAYTGRSLVWGAGYHGCSDTWISAEEPGVGTFWQFYQKFPDLDALIGNLEILDKDAGLLAAVIVEPVQLDWDVQDKLRRLRELCAEREIVLIFDEVITGFRVPNYSIANLWSIQPDLICLGKALGSGHPIAIMGGKQDIMDTEGVFISNTHNGELSGINAALNVLDYLTEDKLSALWSHGKRFQDAFNAINPRIQIVGYPTRGELRGEELLRALFIQEMAKRGYFWGKAWFMHFGFDGWFLSKVLDVAREISADIEAGRVALEGKMPQAAFRRNP